MNLYILWRKRAPYSDILKYLDGQINGQCMASAPPVSGELLVRGNVESELEETLRTVGRSPDFDKST